MRNTLNLPTSTTSTLRTESHETEVKDARPEEDEGIFGEMFDSELKDTGSKTLFGSQNTSTKLRDFGKPVGINPRKVLDDFCHSR